ncbi:MAG: hypothetical protein OXN96_19220 [Bryobacterales bacterium]|nr:hypothetical protein [Bryobacterales bacterium]
MTILKRGADAALSARFMYRPNAGAGETFAHLLLLPIFERALPARINSYRVRLCRDTGYREPKAATAAAGKRRSTAHLLAMHAVHCLSRPMKETRPFRGERAFRGLQLHCLWALDRIAEMEAFGGGDDES